MRIALALKGLEHTVQPIHLTREGGEQHFPDYKAINPQGLVPALNTGGVVLTQSLAIIEYLDERYPDPPLLPKAPLDLARVRAMALTVAADIHPIQNLRVLNYLRKQLAQPDDAVNAWARHWIEDGLQALQALIERESPRSTYCFGNQVTMADICLAPQMVNARRFGCDLSAVQRLITVDKALSRLPAFTTTSSEVNA